MIRSITILKQLLSIVSFTLASISASLAALFSALVRVFVWAQHVEKETITEVKIRNTVFFIT